MTISELTEMLEKEKNEPIILKPCPFCGGEATKKSRDYELYIKCVKCGIQTPLFTCNGMEDYKKKVVPVWNIRTNAKPKAKWISTGGYIEDNIIYAKNCYCSNCHKATYGEIAIRDLPKECPVCGCDMN